MKRSVIQRWASIVSGCLALLAVLATAATPAMAVLPDEVLRDPRLEVRARTISQDLRCVVCQNQSIDDSNAPLARDLRVLLRERLLAGDDDRQAIDYIVARFGNFVLLKPPMQWNTLLLWVGPALILLIASMGFAVFIRRAQAPQSETPLVLSDAEQKRIDMLIRNQEPA